MRLKPIVSYTHILVAILILAGLTACDRPKPEPTIANDSGPQEKRSLLADKVKIALKDNIFLKPQGLEVVVVDEKDGFVKLSLIKGNREVRELLAGGADLDSYMFVETAAARQSLTALKKAVGYVKTIDGVKAVLVTAEETNTALNQTKNIDQPDWIESSVTMKSMPAGGDAKAISWKVANERWVQNTYANGDVTMCDKDTGRMWLHSVKVCGKKDWSDAVAYCDKLTYAGYSDWRLPDKDALEAQLGQKDYFAGAQDGYVWSGTPKAGSDEVWFGNMNIGRVSETMKRHRLYVWPVRGGR